MSLDATHKLSRVPTRYCLDTSALNALLDEEDPDVPLCALNQLGTGTVSALNIVEVCQTTDFDRRTNLLRLLNQIRGGADVVPLPMPNDLLRASLVEIHAHGRVKQMKIDELPSVLKELLNNPQLYADEERRAECLKWTRGLHDPWKKAHPKAREEFDRLFAQDAAARPKTSAQWMKDLFGDQSLLEWLCREIYSTLTEAPAPESLDTQALFRESAELRLYLFTLAHPIFHRAVKNPHAKPNINIKAETVDYWFSLYLPHCEHFFTGDRSQYRALRQAKVLQPRCRQVVCYHEWRKTVRQA